MGGAAITLHQFPFSHYNEKVRWALDWKGLPHRRVPYLPGPHAPQIQRLSGQTQTPVVRFGSEVVFGSSRIVEELERRHPDPPLFPSDPAERTRALEIVRYFDEEVGVRARQALFAVSVHEADWMCRVFSTGRSLPVRALYRATFPLAKTVLIRSMSLGDESAVAEANAATQRALDFVARETAATGQLVGERFTVADLTAAALLAVLTDPDHPDMDRGAPTPPAVAEFLARWSAHPGIAWVHEQYRRHRPPPNAI